MERGPLAGLRKLLGTGYISQVATLAAGTAVAQLVLIAVTPLLSRLYSPEDFGFYAIYTALVALVLPAATAKYDQAVMLPAAERDADALVVLSVAIALAVGMLIFLATAAFSATVARGLGARENIPWLPLAGLSVVMFGSNSALTFWLNRRSAYRRMSFNRIAQAVIASVIQILVGLWYPTALGLVGGMLIGQALTTLALASTFVRTAEIRELMGKDRARLSNVAATYRNHAKHILPGQWIGSATLQIPTFAIASVYGVAATGFFALATRMVTIPTMLVASAVGDVYRRKASENYRSGGEFSQLFKATVSRLAAVAAFPSLLVVLFAPEIFEFAFGQDWRTAGEYARILTVASLFQFVLTPVDKGAVIVGATGYILAWNILRFVLNAGLAGIALTNEIMILQFLTALAAINIGIYVVGGVFEYRFSRGSGT